MLNPGAELWRAVRHPERAGEGTSQVRTPEAGVLVHSYGQDWRIYRTRWLIPVSAALFGSVASALALYFLVRGRIPIHGGLSGKRILRTSRSERIIHWLNAAVFLTLAVTGLLMLYGRGLLLPVLGQQGFAQVAAASKLIHNYLGPLFIVSLALVFSAFVRESCLMPTVWERWVVRLGGYFGGREPVSGKFNPGQQAWFWTLILFGALICLSGLVLDFPLFGLGRPSMMLAHVVHTLAAVVVIAFLLVHVYLGGIGIVGVFGTMVHGYVDAHWAHQHHYCWYRDMERKGKVESVPEDAPP